LKRNIDTRTTKHLLTKGSGGLTRHQFEEYSDVATDDGYILTLHRIANRESFNVVYFQHGVLDNSVAWVLHGPHHGIAQLVSEELGCDVFMGNFRGVYPRKTAEWRRPEEYWNHVGLNEYAE
jgi:Partial alpha/beta-hydrolase lipase region